MGPGFEPGPRPPSSCSPNPGPGRAAPLTRSSGAPSRLSPGFRGPDPGQGPRASSGRPAYARRACADPEPELQAPAAPPLPPSAHLRSRAAPVAPPRGTAPFPPTRPGPLWPGLRLVSVSAPLPHPGLVPGAGPRVRPVGRAAHLRFPLPSLRAVVPGKEILFLQTFRNRSEHKRFSSDLVISSTGQTRANVPGSVNDVMDPHQASHGY